MVSSDEILELTERFDRNRESYLSGQYNETQLRREFLDPLFMALGWDVNNKQGYAEAYKDVIHEDALKIGSAVKAPDYCFRIGGTRKFFVEAKKPSVNLKDDISPAFQLRRYAWSAKLPLSILTDFEEFAVYDCRVKPVKTDKASTARILYMTYKEYAQRWDEISSVFTREAVLKGSFDKYAEKGRHKKGTAEVDAAFLAEIELWRDILARNIALRNAGLTQRELNFSVQRTIDRIIFLRICEDRGIELYGRLMSLLNGVNVYKRLFQIFRSADERYNSGLFHFEKEKDRHEFPDDLTPSLDIDDRILKDMIKRLYYPESPYEFSVLPADILGQVYEQFLGKVIRLTEGHRAVVEEKPEVRKAGGVYYTPTYIVDYIVRNTVGNLLGPGLGAQGPGKGELYGDSDISGFGSLAGSNEPDNRCVPSHEDIPEGRALRINKPDTACGSVSACQHSGGTQSKIEKRVSSSCIDRQRLSFGAGNSLDDCQTPGISSTAGHGKDMGSCAKSGANAKRTYSLSQTPAPRTLTPKDVSKIRILDPACGSGSFLLGAYQYLLDWHRDWYENNDPQKWVAGKNPALYQAQGGEWRLTTAERKRILLNNIFGVDIDSQAVEVTKLSLLLKVLEGENNQTLERQMKFFHERALPDLGDNIKCGNSLIGPDFYDGLFEPVGARHAVPLHLDEEERYRINVFDWEKEFPAIMKAGGFDAVIGNPPYIRIQALKEWAPTEVEFYKKQYIAASKGNYDIYVNFAERGLSLLNKNGLLSFILPHKFFNAKYGQPLRSLLAKGKHLSHVVHFGDQQVFSGATTYTCLMFLAKGGSDTCRIVRVPDLSAWRTSGLAIEGTILASSITAAEWNFNIGAWALLYERLNSFHSKLRDIAHLFVGLQTDADDVFILEKMRRDGKRVLCHSKSTGRDHWFEDEHLKPFLKGSLNIRRYYLADVTKRLIFPYETIDGKSVIISTKKYQEHYPLTWEYLQENIERLKARNKGQMGIAWYGYVYKKNHTRFDFPKLLVPSIATGSCFASDLDGKYYFVGSGGGGGGGYGIALQEPSDMSFMYLLGLLNSTLLSAYLKAISTPFRGGYIALNRQYIEQLPIRMISFSDATDKASHDKMVCLVEQMLSLNKALPTAKTDHEKTSLQRQIAATDKQIDRLVYELYGLTEEEIRIVEGAG